MNVPDIGNLLGKISEKRDELPKTERQHVVTVPETEKQENVQSEKPQNDKSFTQKNKKTEEQEKKKTGRPTAKDKENIEYVRLGCNIPKLVRQQSRDAINYERFKTPEGEPIKTLDELVTLALTKLLQL